MAQIQYCPRGHVEGLWVTHEELEALAKEKGARFIDEWVPVPGRVPEECPEEYHETLEDLVYYEDAEGDHGWACRKCGAVVQWG